MEEEANYVYSNPGEESQACNCLQSCNSIDYGADVIRSDYKTENYLEVQNNDILSIDYVNWTRRLVIIIVFTEFALIFRLICYK